MIKTQTCQVDLWFNVTGLVYWAAYLIGPIMVVVTTGTIRGVCVTSKGSRTSFVYLVD
ncbi:hypothetical protein Hanom_Chr15g01371841 [Helianthus anomalus]